MVYKFKLVYLVLDGVADSLEDMVTTLELSKKPGLDWIAKNGVCGLMYTVEQGVAPESDEAVISIIGYNPHEVYTGRGPLEALGAGLEFKENYEVAFRANFATIDPDTMRILDRRVGRNLTTNEAKELAKSLEYVDLGIYDGYARVKATIGHRAVVIIGSKTERLSPYVSNNDPAYTRKGLVSIASEMYEPYVKPVEPLENTREARIAAELANRFFDIVVEMLREHPVNRERVAKGLPPANAILLRDAGNRLPKAESLSVKYGCKFAVLAEMPVEVGIGRAFGAETIQLDPPTGDPRQDYTIRLEKVLEALDKNDIVYVHLKGPDEPGHDGNVELKKAKIEEIDRYFVQPLIEHAKDRFAVLVTSDHATPPSRRSHTDDPVPVAFYMPGIEPDSVDSFTERACARGVLGVVKHGWELLPKLISMYLKR